MLTGQRRLSKVLFFTVTILLATSFFGLLYFVQIEQNEDYQNQLHFRELNEIGTGLSDAIKQLSNVANVPNDPLNTALDIIDQLLDGSITLPSGSDSEEDATGVADLENELWLTEDKINELIEQYIDTALIGFDDAEIAGLVAEHCETNEGEKYCSYFGNIYDELTYNQYWWHNFYETDVESFDKQLVDSWQMQYEDLSAQVKAETELIWALSKMAERALYLSRLKMPSVELPKLEQQAKKLCADSTASWCDDLYVKPQQRQPQQKSKSAYTQQPLSQSAILSQFRQQEERLTAFNTQQLSLLKLFTNTWKALVSVINESEISIDTDVEVDTDPKTKLLNELGDNLLIAKATHKKLDNGDSASSNPLRDLWIQSRLSAIESVESLSRQHGWGRISDDNIYNRAANALRKGIPYQQPEVDIGEEAPHLANNNEVATTPSQTIKAFVKEFREKYVATLLRVQLRQRVRLANGGDTLTNLTLSQIKSASGTSQTTTNESELEKKVPDPCASQPPTAISTAMRMGLFREHVKAGIADLCFSVPTEDLLANNLERFPLIMVADSSGQVLARATSLERSIDPADLEFEQAKGLFSALVKQQNLGDAKTPHFSGILEQVIGGITYKLYIQPVSTPMALVNDQALFLIGLIPLSEIRFAKLSVSPSTAMWFVLGVVAIMAAVPLVKIRFVSLRYSFSSADISQLGLGFVILAGVLSIGISDQLFFSYFKQSKTEQALQIHEQIKSEFSIELETILNYRPAVTGPLSAADKPCIQRFNRSNPVRSQTQGSDYVYFQNCDNANLKIGTQSEADDLVYLLEGSFSLDARGLFNTSGDANMMSVDTLAPSRWLHGGMYIANDINLSHRQYFKQALTCDYPMQSANQSCRQGFAIERIANSRDGRKSTQFGFSEFDSLHGTQANNRTISSIGTRLRTFFSRVLPNNFGYLVFEPSGKVLYHSEDERALLENIFIETNNNPQLRTLVNYQEAGQFPVSFETLYRDQEHLFLTSQLHSELPWYLAIYHSQTPTLNSNMLLVFISISLFIVIVAPLFLWCRYATDQDFWRRWFMYNRAHAALYCRFAWWSAGIVMFAVMSMGLIHELSLRLVLWLILVIVLLTRLNEQFIPKKLRRLNATHPVIPFFAVLVVMLLVSAPELLNVSWGNSPEDRCAFFIGVLIFAASIIGGIHHSKRPAKNLHNRRYPRAYLWYLVSLLWVFSVLPALLVVNSANKYLLHHQAHLDSAHLEAANDSYQKEVSSYLELMKIDQPENYQKTQWLSEENLSQLYPAANTNNHLAWVELNAVQSANEQADQTVDAEVVVSIDEEIQVAATDEVNQVTEVATGIDTHEANEAGEMDVTDETYQADRADLMISKLVGIADIGGSINAELHYLTKSDNQNSAKPPLLNYDADKFLLSASVSQWGLIGITQLLLLLGAYKVVRILIVQRLMGEHLPTNFRQNDTTKLNQKLAWFEDNFKRIRHLRVQLMRSSPQRACDLFRHRLGVSIYRDRVLHIEDCLTQFDGQFELVEALQAEPKSKQLNLLLAGLDDLAFYRSQRRLALRLLNSLHAQPHLNIVLLCEVAPLFRLCKPEAYPGIAEEELSDQSEMLAWANLLTNFDKEYDWSPSGKDQLPMKPDAFEVLKYEQQGWPQLTPVGDIFARYHGGVKCSEVERDDPDSCVNKYWDQDQVVEFFASHAGALYRQKWQQCTKDEKLLLFQVASGDTVNPNNVEVLEHLVRRGYVYRDQGWHLINLSFKRFVLTAENEEDMAQWQSEAKNSVWQILKLPILVVVLVLVALILLGTGEGLESILGIMSAMLGLIPLLLRNIGAFSQSSLSGG